MHYLNASRMAEIDPQAFRNKQPFPWISVQGLLKNDSFRRLCGRLPDVASCEKQSGRRNGCGDLYALQHRGGLTVAPEWREFIAELQRGPYTNFCVVCWDFVQVSILN
jgi:hypothetical protein